MDVMKPWIAKRITEMLGFEDDIVVESGRPKVTGKLRVRVGKTSGGEEKFCFLRGGVFGSIFFGLTHQVC